MIRTLKEKILLDLDTRHYLKVLNVRMHNIRRDAEQENIQIQYFFFHKDKSGISFKLLYVLS